MKCRILKSLNHRDLQIDNKIDYSVYKFSFIEYIRYIMEGVIILAVVAYLFYEKIIAFILLTPILYFYIKRKNQQLQDRRKKDLKLQFRDLCISVSSSLSAGNSLSNSIISSRLEMVEMYGEEALISKELELMIKSLKMNIPVETMFESFAFRSGIDEIKLFSEILNIAHKGGGDMIKIMKTTADGIGQKVEVEKDIQSVISSKKYEQAIMNGVPFLIILYMKVTSPGTMDVMYKTYYGVIIMTICLLAYGAAYIMGKKLTEIEV